MPTIVFVAASIICLGAPIPGDGATETRLLEDEKVRFRGTWQLVSAEYDGKKATADEIKGGRVTVGSGTYTVRYDNAVVAQNVGFEIDPARSPKHVTDTLPSGPHQGKVILGIYRLEGDTLTSCVAPLGHDRPTRFAAESGSGRTLRVFRRMQSADADRRKP
jgi:uncharacterized protein (TIGR03067 family)